MKLAILPLLFISLLSFEAKPNIWNCVCDYVLGKEAPGKLHSCIPNEVIENSLKLQRGFKIKFNYKNQNIEGVVLSQDLDSITIEVKNKVRQLKAKNIHDIHFIEKTPLPENSFITKKEEAIKKYSNQLIKNKKIVEKLKMPIKQEIDYLRTLSNKEARVKYLREVGSEIEKNIQTSIGSKHLGYHFNLNGGLDYQYSQSGGILINRGDVFANHGMSQHTAENVYFFRSENIGFYDLIDSGDMRKVIGKGRMGDALVIFDLDHPYFARAIEEKGITAGTEIYFDFNPNWLRKQAFNNPDGGRLVGIPAETFVTPPMSIYKRAQAREMGLKNLSREEENLFYMRLIEERILAR